MDGVGQPGPTRIRSRSFGENPHLGVLLLDVNGEVDQVGQVAHQLVDVLGFELGDVSQWVRLSCGALR
jgi:hypothetical protein